MRFSIVTVCFNEEDSVAGTIKSVLGQTSTSFEYIICDGASTDNTLKIAEEFKDEFKKRGIRYRLISEKDGGIYDGMNNGIKIAQGEYINFLNAGDRFHDESVLANIACEIETNKADIIFGDVILVERGFGKLIVSNDNVLDNGMSICHQSMFIKSKLMKKYPYNTRYRIVADYDFTLKMKRMGMCFKKSNIVIADFRAGGVSTTQTDRIAEEYYDIRSRTGISVNLDLLKKNMKKEYRYYKFREKLPMCVWRIYCIFKGREKVETM